MPSSIWEKPEAINGEDGEQLPLLKTLKDKDEGGEMVF
jgi:hypothetical protein